MPHGLILPGRCCGFSPTSHQQRLWSMCHSISFFFYELWCCSFDRCPEFDWAVLGWCQRLHDATKELYIFLKSKLCKACKQFDVFKKKNWRTFSHSHEEDLNQNANDGGDKLCSRFRTSRSDKPTRACEVKVAVLRIYQPAFNNYTTSKLIKEPVYLSVDAKGASKSSPKIHTVPHLWMFLKTALCSHLWSAPYFVFSLYLGLICMQPAFCSL